MKIIKNKIIDDNSILSVVVELYEQGHYFVALEQAKNGLKFLQENDLLDDQYAKDLIDLIGNIYFDISRSSPNILEAMIDNLEKISNILPSHLDVTSVNIARAKYNIAFEYSKVERPDYDVIIKYSTEAYEELKDVYPNMDHEYFSIILNFIAEICETLNQNHIKRLFIEENFVNMNIVAKVVYALVSEILNDHNQTPRYMISLGVSYLKIGEQELGSKILNEVQNLLNNSSFFDRSELEEDIKFYFGEDNKNESESGDAFLISSLQAFYTLSKGYVENENYSMTINSLKKAQNIIKKIAFNDQPKYSAELLVHMNDTSSIMVSSILNNYENNEYNLGIEISIIALEGFLIFGNNCYVEQFNNLIALGYCKSKKYEEAAKYFIKESAGECDLSDFYIIKTAVNECEAVIKKESSMEILKDICAYKGYIDLYECKLYIIDILQTIDPSI